MRSLAAVSLAVVDREGQMSEVYRLLLSWLLVVFVVSLVSRVCLDFCLVESMACLEGVNPLLLQSMLFRQSWSSLPAAGSSVGSV